MTGLDDRDVPPEAVRAQLARILAHPLFSKAERLRKFLAFVVEEAIEGRSSGLKESSIALEVFRRDSSFDPKTDSVVRVDARTLRTRLSEYYRTAGQGDAVTIEIPKGAYVPVFRVVERAAAARAAGPRVGIAVGAAMAGLAVAAAGFLLWNGGAGRMGASHAPPSVGVLPFLDLTASAATEGFADGFVEDLTTRLAGLPKLRVAARTSAFQFRGGGDVREIGGKLGVAAILEGSVRRNGGSVRITAQLVETAKGYHLWSRSYERGVAEVAAIEEDIARSVARVLGLPQGAGAAGGARHAPSPEARDAYWRGRYLRRSPLPEKRAASVASLEESARLDPRYGEAWAALAATHAIMAFHGEGDRESHIAQSRQTASRALALDPANPETQVALATVAYAFDRDWAAAERHFRKAIELNPSYAWARRGFATGLLSRGRFEEAAEEVRRAAELDPLSDILSNEMPTVLLCAGRCEEASSLARRKLDVDAGFVPARVALGICLEARGRHEEAVAEFRQTAQSTGGAPDQLGRLAHALAGAGRSKEAREVAGRIESARGTGRDFAVYLALAHTGLGDRVQALRYLREAVSRRETDAVFMMVEPVFEPLRSDPKFQALAREAGLSPR